MLSKIDAEIYGVEVKLVKTPPSHWENQTDMKISTVLDHIDSGHMALPEFQRGYVWNRDQVRKLFTSLYLRRPVGGLLVWATESKTAAHRGDGQLAAGVVKLLLDRQQRMTSLYGVVRGSGRCSSTATPRPSRDCASRPGSETVHVALPAPSGWRSTGVGDRIQDGRTSWGWAARGRRGEAPARSPATHDLTVRSGAGEAAHVLRRQRQGVHGVALRDQVRKLFTSLYLRRPVGGLLVWATEFQTAAHRGDGQLAAGVVKLLLDAQQRMTSLYGVVRGKPPMFFDGNAKAFTGLRFNLNTQNFEFYQPLKMQDDPLWIDVTELMRHRDHGDR